MKISEIFWSAACLASEHMYATNWAVGCTCCEMRLACEFIKTIFTAEEMQNSNANQRFFMALMACEIAKEEGL